MDKLLSIEEIFLAKKDELNRRIRSFYKDESANLKDFRAWIKACTVESLCSALTSDNDLLLNVNQRGGIGDDRTYAESTLKEDTTFPANGTTLRKTFIEPKESLVPSTNRPKRSAAVKAREKTFQSVNMPLGTKLRRPSNYLSLTTVTVPVKRKSSESSDKAPKKQKIDTHGSSRMTAQSIQNEESNTTLPDKSPDDIVNVATTNPVGLPTDSKEKHHDDTVNDPTSALKKTDESDKTALTTATSKEESHQAVIDNPVNMAVSYNICEKHTTLKVDCDPCLKMSVKSSKVILSPLPQQKIEKYINGSALKENVDQRCSVHEIESKELIITDENSIEILDDADQNQKSGLPEPSPVNDHEIVSAPEVVDTNKITHIDDTTACKAVEQSPVAIQNQQSANEVAMEVHNATSSDIFSTSHVKPKEEDGDDVVPINQCDATFEVQEVGRPKRTKIKPKKFEDDMFIVESSDKPKRTRTKVLKPQPSQENTLSDPEDVSCDHKNVGNVKEANSELPESDRLCSNTEESSKQQKNDDVFKVPLALDTLPLPKVEDVHEKPVRTRTKTLKKAVNENLPVVEILPERTTRTRSKMLQKSEKVDEQCGEIHATPKSEDNTELTEEQSTENEEPGVRTRTRTKVKERVQQLEEVIQSQVKMEAELPKTVKPSKIKISPGDIGKENSVTKIPTSIERYPQKGTPLATSNRIFSPLNYKNLSSCEKLKFPIKVGDEEVHMKRIEEAKKKMMKEEEALKKKNEMIKAQTEELRRKREMKLKKVAAAREAEEKEKLELRKKLAREKEEKEKAARAEKERQKENMLLKKKLLNQQKAQEAEERRLKEEALRIAKQKEIEEEQRKQAEYKLKMQQEAERLHQERLAEKAREAKQLKEQLLEKAKLKMKNLQKDASYDMTPPRTERPILSPKNQNDYGIDDLNSSDSSEDEHRPKKKIPTWAIKANRQLPLKLQFYVPLACKQKFMKCPSRTPDLAAMFGEHVGKRVRTSSAVWRTPPNLSIIY